MSKASDSTWVTIKHRAMLALILRAYHDDTKSKILEMAVRPETIPDIISETRLPKASTYRKVNSLLRDYLLFPVAHVITKNGKLVTKYVALFERLEITTEKNEMSVKAKINKDIPYIIFKMVGERPGYTIEEKIIRKIQHSQNEREMIKRLAKHIEKRGLNKTKLANEDQSKKRPASHKPQVKI